MKGKITKSQWITIILWVVMLFSGYQILHNLFEEEETQSYYDSLQEFVSTPAKNEEPTLQPPSTSKQPWTWLFGRANAEAFTPSPESTPPLPIAETAPILVNFDALLALNSEVTAWLYCQDTKVNYPVLHADDNKKYLYHRLNGDYNKAGSLFVDYRNVRDFSDWNTIIYGHNMRDGSMFATLKHYGKQDFYDFHPIWYLLTPTTSYQVDLIAGYHTTPRAQTYTIPLDVEERDALIRLAKEKSTFVSNVEVGEKDRLVTLSTCWRTFQGSRYVLLGVLRPIAEQENDYMNGLFFR